MKKNDEDTGTASNEAPEAAGDAGCDAWPTEFMYRRLSVS